MEDDFDEGAPWPGTLLGSCCPLRFQKSPAGVPAPGALRLAPVFALFEVASLEGVHLLGDSFIEGVSLTEDDFDTGHPIENRYLKGDSSPNSCYS